MDGRGIENADASGGFPTASIFQVDDDCSDELIERTLSPECILEGFIALQVSTLRPICL